MADVGLNSILWVSGQWHWLGWPVMAGLVLAAGALIASILRDAQDKIDGR